MDSWDELNRRLKKMTEAECAALLEAEEAGRARTSFLIRIYGRFNTLRTQRERRELIGRSRE